jgi:probable F420-dependent oxidoreductase
MAPKIGYLLPTRENIMEGRPEAAPLLQLAERAEGLGYDSVWVGDSLLARPRHEPMTLLAAAAARTTKVELGTAVLLPALRNPVVLAHMVATVDQVSQGRLILGVGIATDVPNIRAEFEAAGVPFEKRVGRMMEGLRLARALWTGEPVTWEGRWTLKDQTLGPVPHRKGGPPLWGGGNAPGALARAGRSLDGWFPTGPDASAFGAQWDEVQDHAREAGRDPSALTCAIYLTIAVDDDAGRGERRIDEFLESYYGASASILRKRQACFGGPPGAAAEFMQSYADAGATHIVLRFAGDHERQQEVMARVRQDLGW